MSSEDENVDLDATIVDVHTEDVQGASVDRQVNAGIDPIASLVASIVSLRESVNELRNETKRGQSEIQQLRTRIESDISNVPHPSTVQSPPPFTSTQRSLSTISTLPQNTLSPQQSLPQSNQMQQSLPPSAQLPQQPQPQSCYMPPQPQSTQSPLPTPMPYNGVLSFMENSAAKLYPLPPFDGNPEDWPLFLANYRDTTNEFGYNNRQNLMRLHKSLQGNAKRAVTSLLIYPDDVPLIIKELEFNFGRPDLLIRSQMQKVQQFPAIHENHLSQVLSFSNHVRNIVAFFKSAKCEHHLMNPTLLEQLVCKLPPSKQYEWSRHAASVLPFPTVETFADWISDFARVVSLMPGISEMSLRPNQPRQVSQHNANRQQTSSGGAVRRVLHSSETKPDQQKQVVCIQCNQSHNLSHCQQFKELNTNDKWVQVKGHRLCFGCLRKGHNLTNCRARKACGINGCVRLHNQLLHQDYNKPPEPSTSGIAETEHVLNCRQELQSSLFKILPVTLFGPHGSISIYAMFDEGSSISLLEEDIAVKLGLRGQSMPLTLQWYGDSKTTESSRNVAVNVRGENDGETFALKNVQTIKQLNLPTQTFRKEKYGHLQSLPIVNYTDAKPSLLLGLDNCCLGISNETVEDGPDKPIAIETKLGWLAFGPVQPKSCDMPRVMHVRETSTLKQLNRLVEEYFSIDSFGVRSTNVILESDENNRARKILQETTKEIGQKYEVGLLWRNDDVVLPKSYNMAKQRLLNIEAKMAKNTMFAANYKAEIEKYIEKGYARLLTTEEAQRDEPTTWYLPHFGVVNCHKPNKLRIVFDAAAATANISLNSALLKGPEHAQSLVAIIHKFRQGVVAVAGDIQEMFSQVRIAAADQEAQRFLWRDGKSSEPIRIYAMQSMIFGAICSPCCAEHIKNLNAHKFESTMPRGVKAVIHNTYVDDLVISFDSVNEAIDVTLEAIKINAAAGFKLRKFVSNCKTLQLELNKDNNAQSEVINMERQANIDKVLGMFWNTVEDAFEFHFKFHKIARDVLECKRPPTKRELLGIVMAIYDPFGILANTTIFAKLLLQSMWKQQIDWDEPLPNQLNVQWTAWWKEFQKVETISVQRCYSKLLQAADEIQLHIFVDASSSAYAAVAYLRIRKGSEIDVAFVAGKTRCAPAKGMTIPRLELQAAILGSRMKTSIIECHNFTIDSTTFWSDSKTVILWIRSTTREYKQFVACRIAEILATTSPMEWRWIPTELNVSDDATRAKLPLNFDSKSRWLLGPDLLHQEEEFWPQESTDMTSEHCAVEESSKQVLLLSGSSDSLFDFTKFSSYLKMLRVVGWIFRFINNTRLHDRQVEELTAIELQDAENFACRQVQGVVYSTEIAALRSDKGVPRTSNLHQLTPYLDDTGLLRINGRIDAAYCLPVTARRPIILPPNHHLTRLIMNHYHQKEHHQNDCLTINEMRQKFWVPRARAVLNFIKRSCPVCIYNRAKPAVPLMGQLPPDRLTPFVRPFSYTGVDYCGPFFVAIGRRREKRWVALYTCLTTRAIHLEIAEDLSTDAFLICFRNFVNRRGMPIRIRSDNGTNFVGAQKELKKEERLFDLDRISRSMARDNIQWTFNCPANPHAGGCWERLVQCVKRLLQRILKEEAPRLETFRSVLIEAENIINSRPLTDIPVTPEDEEPLTPNHFLVGCLNSTQTPSVEDEKVCLRKQWKIAQNLKDRMWKRWTVEYLPQLLRRSKWRDEKTPLQPGQLVIVCDPGLPRKQWQKGRITEVFTAKDGQVRTAEIRTSHGLIRRPACKLAALTL